MENLENIVFFVYGVCCFLVILISIMFIKQCVKKSEFIKCQDIIKNQQKIINLFTVLIQDNSEEEFSLINVIKKNEISSLDLDDEYFINYYSERIKKWDTETIGRHLIYLEKQLLGFFKYQSVGEKLHYCLKKAIIKNISLSAKITADCINKNNIYTEKCKYIILTAFSEKNKEIFPYNNEREKNVSSFLRLFLEKLEKSISLICEEETEENKRNIEMRFIGTIFFLNI